MNKKLAIARLESVLNYTDNTLNLKDVSVDELMSIFELAIDCISRQVPKPPNGGKGTDEGDCPNCFEVVEGDFCPNCGQAIDWEDRRREVIFRGKQLGSGEWVYGNLLSGAGKSFIGVLTVAEDGVADSELVEVDPYTVGQHIGIKDIDGKHIFEGDVVMIGYTDFPIVFVATWAWRLENAFEVVLLGNTYDNPEMIQNIENI